MMNLMMQNFNVLMNVGIILSLLILMYSSTSLMVYILSFFMMMVNLSLIMFLLGWEFVSLWLLIMYGGSIMMFIVMISMLCSMEFSTSIPNISLKQLFLDIIILVFFMYFLWKFLNYICFQVPFINYYNSGTVNYMVYYTLFFVYNKLILWMGILLMLMMIFVMEMQDYSRKK